MNTETAPAILENARCRGCGYALRGLTSIRCPECGREFDPEDTTTMWYPANPGSFVNWMLAPPGRVTYFLAMGLSVLLFFEMAPPGAAGPSLVVSVILILATLISWTRTLSCRLLYHAACGAWAYPLTDQQWKRQRHIAILFLSMMLIAVIRPGLSLVFWISRPALEKEAKQIMAAPFADALPPGGRFVGCYYVTSFYKCPHGVAMRLWGGTFLIDESDLTLRSYGGAVLFYKPVPGTCDRFSDGRALGGAWHFQGW